MASIGSEPATRGDWHALVRLFGQASPMRVCHWNPLTGEMFCAPRGRSGRAAVAAFGLRILREEGWLEVPFLESDQAFALAVEWVDGLASGRGKTLAQQAISAEKPFRQLRAVLGRMPGLARRYEQRVREEAEARLVEFCVGLGLCLDHPKFRELAPLFADATAAPVGGNVARRAAGALSIGRPPCA